MPLHEKGIIYVMENDKRISQIVVKRSQLGFYEYSLAIFFPEINEFSLQKHETSI